MQSSKTISPVILAFAINLVASTSVFTLNSQAAQVQPSSPASWQCETLFAETIKQDRKIPWTDLQSAQNKATFLRELLNEKNLSFIDPKFLDFISQDPKNQQIVERLEAFDFTAREASENLLQLLKDLRKIATNSTTWRERTHNLKNKLIGPNRQELLDDATNLVLTKEAIDVYLTKNLSSPTQSRLRSRLKNFIHGTFSILKPIASASLASWFLDFPIWLHRSHSLEDLNGGTLTDTSSLKMKSSLWLDLTTDKLRRVTLVAMFLFNSTTWVLGIEGNLLDYGKKAWTELNTAVVVTEAYATFDAEKPGMDPTALARTMDTQEYAMWAAEYQREYNQKPDPENNAVDLLLWQTSRK